MNIKKVDHVHLVVNSIEEALKSYYSILGLNPWNLGINNLPNARQTMLVPKDGARIELIEPKSEQHRFYKSLKECGEGVYGISIIIDNFDEEVKRLKEKGIHLDEQNISLFPDGPLRLAWVPPEDGHGVWLELVDEESLPDFEKNWELPD